MTSRSVISGWNIENSQATAPPQSWPTMTAWSRPSSRITAATSATSTRRSYCSTPRRLVAQVVATLVDGDHMIAVRQRRHLVAPRVPEVREPVDHDDERTPPGTQGGVTVQARRARMFSRT